MKLINFDGTDFSIADEALLVRPIRELFQQDKSKKKEDFWRQISYLWFMCDPRSSYMYLTEKEERAKEVKKQEGFEEGWQPSALLQECMDIYQKQTITTPALLLEGMRKGMDNVTRFFCDVDLFDTIGKKDKPMEQLATMTKVLEQIPKLAKALSDAEKALEKDFLTEDKARGSTEKAAGEDW